MTDTNLIEIFCIFDDFCKYFTPELKKHTLQVPGKRTVTVLPVCRTVKSWFCSIPTASETSSPST